MASATGDPPGGKTGSDRPAGRVAASQSISWSSLEMPQFMSNN